ncbi:ABC-type branched-subunit amino acid transport system substrate-binding protein [Hydrogenophaga palleronii]|uniref:ABC-type branched-subunit amino acid transport system substrate-binding protein n=1 Tax=Hydrogenophaga palleronii TaxID=65655 RepID=A0ABU1WSM3_9BURK|nr:ABC-type branched-subunit amino acid transport system substrate-binding protein [Hydrogenophaga palleronii]
MMEGVRLAIEHLGEAGVPKGGRLELRALDDGGDPQKALDNTRSLAQAGAIAVTAYHGTKSVEASLPVLEAHQLALVGAASSAESLREPPRRTLFHLRAGALEEMQAIVLHLDTLGLLRIGVISQDDGLGAAGSEQLAAELVRIGLRPVAASRIRKEDDAGVSTAVGSVCESRPQAVILAVSARLVHRTVKFARHAGCHAQFVVMSETGAALRAVTGEAARELAGLVVSQVVPHPKQLSHPLIAAYARDAARKPGAAPSYPAVEGYLYMRALGEAIRLCGANVSRECVLKTLETKPLALPGFKVNFEKGQRRGSAFVELTLLRADGGFRR